MGGKYFSLIPRFQFYILGVGARTERLNWQLESTHKCKMENLVCGMMCVWVGGGGGEGQGGERRGRKEREEEGREGGRIRGSREWVCTCVFGKR